MTGSDPKGYYAILKLSPTASAADIKVTFRRRAKELHPDRNKSPNATKDFQYLNEAYSVLNDPSERAKYDTLEVETSDQQNTATETPPEPIVCSVCTKVTAQPRYSIFYEVKSFLVSTIRTPIQGIFCSACAEKKVLRASLITWFFGWWGFPFGLIYTPHAIFMNLIGGKQMHDINARLALHQAWAFAVLGNINLSRAIALDALDISRKIRGDDNGAQIKTQIEKFLSSLKTSGPSVRLKNSRFLLSRPFFVQAVFGLIAIGLVWSTVFNETPSPPPRGPKPYIATPSPPPPPPTKVYVRPVTAPNGQPWPATAGYVRGYPRLNSDGLSTVTVDNRENDSDVFVKLVSLDGPRAYPVRSFYIPAHGTYTVRKVTSGNYDVRYRDLNTGRLSRSESFNLQEIPSDEGIQYTNMTLTLYKVLNGNMQSYDLSEEEF